MNQEAPASDRPVPAVTAEIRELARRSPQRWIYSVDPDYDPDGVVPGHAIAGAWPVDETGELGAFLPNPHHYPLPEPTDQVEAAMRRAATGRGSDAEFLDILMTSTVYLPATADADLVGYRDDNGEYVTVLTDPRQAASTTPQLLPVAFADLLRRLPADTAIWINPNGGVSMGASTTQLLTALAAQSTPDLAEPLPEIPRKGSTAGAS